MISKIQISSVGLPEVPAVPRHFLGLAVSLKTQFKPLDLFGRHSVRFKNQILLRKASKYLWQITAVLEIDRLFLDDDDVILADEHVSLKVALPHDAVHVDQNGLVAVRRLPDDFHSFFVRKLGKTTRT